MTQQINLYQAKFRKQRKPLSAREAALGLSLVAAAVAVNGWWLWQKNERLATEAKEVEHRVAQHKAVADKLTAEINQRKKDAQLESAASRAEQQVAATRAVMQLINSGSIGAPNGYSEQLRALARQAVGGMWLTGFTLAANVDENLIRGRTLDAELVPAYLRRLNSERSLQGQRFESMTISVPAETPPAAGASAPKSAPAPKFLEFSVGAAQAAMPPAAETKSALSLAAEAKP